MEISLKTIEYWEEKDWEDLDRAQSIKDLYKVAKKIISRMPKPFVQVCGPIATGGFGSFDLNLDLFNETIKKLQQENLNVFDQMPFEGQMQRIKKKMNTEECVNSILNDFYYPIFKSGFVSTFYFIKNWESSKGASWEHEIASKLGIKVKYL